MSFLFVAGLVLIIFGFVALIVAFFRDPDDKAITFFSAGVALSVAVLCLIGASVHRVPVRNVGIVMSFSKPTGETTGAGLNWTKPWETISDFDASIQTADHLGDRQCITVRTGTQATACIDNKVRWQVKATSAPKLFFDYKTDFNNMRKNYFEAELQSVMSEEFATYNPLANIDVTTGIIKFDLNTLATRIKTKLEARIGSDIIVHSVNIPLIRHDPKTEENIKQFQDVLAQNRILNQKKTNAEIEKAAADLLKSLPQGYLVNKCLDTAKELGKEPGFCLGGGNPVQTPKN